MNYKIRVKNEAESKEAQELFFELGFSWCDIGKSVITTEYVSNFFIFSHERDLDLTHSCDAKIFNSKKDFKEITIPQLKDMVVLKRNDPKDENVYRDGDVPCLYNLYLTSDKNLYFFSCGKSWKLSAINDDADYRKLLKPITKEPVMKEFLVKSQDGKWRLETEVVGDPGDDIIEVPEGADTLAGDERTHYFWKHGVGEKGNMIIGVGESLTHYSGWTDCKDSADVWLGQINCKNSRILWQRETLNDKVASAEAARQSGVFVGTPFSDLPEFDFEAVDEFVESNVEQTLIDRESTYGSFRDVADTTSKLMGVLLNSKNGQILPCAHQEALHMICLKMARIVNGDHNFIESWHDISGYAILIENELRATDGATNSRLTYQKAINGKLQDI
jgi:hypothetical protein